MSAPLCYRPANFFQVASDPSAMETISDALVNERNKVTRVLEQVAPFRVVARTGLAAITSVRAYLVF